MDHATMAATQPHDHMEMRWVPTTDRFGETHMEVRWITVADHAAPVDITHHAA